MSEGIPAGLQLQITTWENDSDFYKTKIINGLTHADTRFMLDICSWFRRIPRGNERLGNKPVEFSKLIEIINTAVEEHPEISPKIKEEFTIKPGEGDGDQAYELITDLLGYPVEDHDRGFCRLFDYFKVFYFKSAVEEITTQFE